MKKNVLRELLNEGKPTLSTRLQTVDPRIVEIVGRTGLYDYVELLAEGTNFSPQELDNWGRTMENFPNMTSIIKVAGDSSNWKYLHRAIAAGIQGVVFADCQTADDVRECIKAITPATPELGGLMTAGGGRAFAGEGGTKVGWQAIKDLVVDVMIENKTAMDNLDEILKVPGIDFVHFGPSDYSLSIGLATIAGKEPEEDAGVMATFKVMITKALKAGVQPRVMTADFEEAQEFFDMGVRHFNCGIDSILLGRAYRTNGKIFREKLGRPVKNVQNVVA